MDLKEKVTEWIKDLYNKLLNNKVKHVCRACHHIFDEEEMSAEDSSLCKECTKRE
ncbi:MAG: hypothetical protein KKG75_04245 [Nanoarchaeota archaeon]|nr:hypothetical protein [Nanoarchaeota archaeon]